MVQKDNSIPELWGLKSGYCEMTTCFSASYMWPTLFLSVHKFCFEITAEQYDSNERDRIINLCNDPVQWSSSVPHIIWKVSLVFRQDESHNCTLIQSKQLQCNHFVSFLSPSLTPSFPPSLFLSCFHIVFHFKNSSDAKKNQATKVVQVPGFADEVPRSQKSHSMWFLHPVLCTVYKQWVLALIST